MTAPEAALGAALIATWAYRLGWHSGAVGMSRAMHGHPRGWARVIAWWKERGTEPVEEQSSDPASNAFAQRLKDALQAQADERPGQYL